jgi:hypothetical protein
MEYHARIGVRYVGALRSLALANVRAHLVRTGKTKERNFPVITPLNRTAYGEVYFTKRNVGASAPKAEAAPHPWTSSLPHMGSRSGRRTPSQGPLSWLHAFTRKPEYALQTTPCS